MTGPAIVAKVKALNLPEGSYIVFGSCPMALVGLREAGDIDILATPEIRQKLAEQGWIEVEKGPKDKPVTKDDFEVHDSWEFSHYSPTLEQLQVTAKIVEGVPFAALDEVRKWKAASGRPKDLKDIQLIDGYLRGSDAGA